MTKKLSALLCLIIAFPALSHAGGGSYSTGSSSYSTGYGGVGTGSSGYSSGHEGGRTSHVHLRDFNRDLNGSIRGGNMYGSRLGHISSAELYGVENNAFRESLREMSDKRSNNFLGRRETLFGFGYTTPGFIEANR